MRCFSLLFLCIVFLSTLSAQQIQTVVPKQAVTVGTAFQLQYVVVDAPPVEIEVNPLYRNFQLASGPHIYKGRTVIDGESKSVENIVYTLVPQAVGQYTIYGIQVKAGTTTLKAKDAKVVVSVQPKQSFNVSSSYTDVSLYGSSRSDLEKIVTENLFITATVDKKTCYEGEPVVATFKLYSRLQSTSEVIKTPALYGFAAVDMVNINQANGKVETINGRIFNTSILRQVQLYPAQSGILSIDPMVVNNLVEFKDDAHPVGKVVLEKEIKTPQINITVKPLPKIKPSNHEGAVGNFSLKAKLEKNQIATNEQGKLLVTIAGKGNFVQFDRPQIAWPAGIEVFELPVEEELEKESVPMKGYKTYVFGFSSNRTGKSIIPSIQFSFFDPVKKQFRTIVTDSLKVEIVAAPKKEAQERASTDEQSNWLPIIAGIFLSLTAILFFVLKRKRKSPEIAEVPKPDFIARIQELQVASMSDKETANHIQQVFLEILKEKYGTANTETLKTKMAPDQFEELIGLLNDCQLISYTTIETRGKKSELKERTLKLAKDLQ
jgi:LPXTG-motif cell wall-anchored protein